MKSSFPTHDVQTWHWYWKLFTFFYRRLSRFGKEFFIYICTFYISPVTEILSEHAPLASCVTWSARHVMSASRELSSWSLIRALPPARPTTVLMHCASLPWPVLSVLQCVCLHNASLRIYHSLLIVLYGDFPSKFRIPIVLHATNCVLHSYCLLTSWYIQQVFLANLIVFSRASFSSPDCVFNSYCSFYCACNGHC